MNAEAALEQVGAVEQKDKAARYAELVSAWVAAADSASLKQFVTHSADRY